MSSVLKGASSVDPLDDESRRPAAGVSLRVVDFVWTQPTPDSHVLSRRRFINQLQIEKRRTDRSKAPVSLVIFRFDSEYLGKLGCMTEIVDVLHHSKRETDLLGYLGEGVIGMLLSDTGRQGLEGFLRNVASRTLGLRYTMTSGTYPDQIFTTLIAETQDRPDTLPVFLEQQTDHGEIELFLKRCVDIVGATALMIAALPVMLMTAIAIKATSPGPVIYRQVRLGRRGRPFTFYKFRSMRSNSDDRIHRLYVLDLIAGKHDQVNQGDAEKPHFKLKNDARVTRVGRFIRKTSIDELPQLFNVLKGDMSLVGPRPPIPYETDNYQSWHLRRILEGRPGITGLWQVRGRNKVTFDEMVRLDLQYSRSWTLWLDCRILIKTVGAVLRLDGDT